jgi:hypothetical protein
VAAPDRRRYDAPTMPSRTPAPALLAVAMLSCGGCASWFFSGLPVPDRSRPVALVETTGGVEYGATTELGVLTLGRTAQTGPCRVHYFLGRAPMIEDGSVRSTGTTFFRAEIDLRTQHVRVHDKPLQPADDLVAIYTPDGVGTVEVAVHKAVGPGIEGDLLHDPGTPLPAGAGVFVRTDSGLRFCGLVTARATLQRDGGDASYYVLAGMDRVRELLALPVRHPPETEVRYRPDDIIVTRPRQ